MGQGHDVAIRRLRLLEVLEPGTEYTQRPYWKSITTSRCDVSLLPELDEYPCALLDRMGGYSYSGFTPKMKKSHRPSLSGRQADVKNNGLKRRADFTHDSLRDIIRYYPVEAGVRGLERQDCQVGPQGST